MDYFLKSPCEIKVSSQCEQQKQIIIVKKFWSERLQKTMLGVPKGVCIQSEYFSLKKYNSVIIPNINVIRCVGVILLVYIKRKVLPYHCI